MKENIDPHSDRAVDAWLREGALVDALNGRNQWREALICQVLPNNHAYVHFLYTSADDNEQLSTDKLRPYGSHVYIGDACNIHAGITVDAYSKEEQKFTVRRVISVDHANRRVKLDSDFTNAWVPMARIFPYRYKSLSSHPDHATRRRILSLQRREQHHLSMSQDADVGYSSHSPSIQSSLPPDAEIELDGDELERLESKEEEGKSERQFGTVLRESKNEEEESSSGSSRSGVVTNNVRRRRLQGLRNPEDHPLRRYEARLEELGYGIVSMEGDGNCLFRTVSHQVYGTPRYHREVRQFCCDYMECESEYFQPFVEGTAEDFQTYIELKRRDGTWGDDIEIQAMCELYNRPAQVFAYDPVLGAKQLRTFHESVGHVKDMTPMRLSFYGGGHYDSIVGPGYHQGLLKVLGQVETQQLQRRTEIGRQIGLSDERSSGEEEDDVLVASRRHYDRLENDIEQALKASLAQAQVDESSMLESAVKESADEKHSTDKEIALRESDIEATERLEIERAIELSKEAAHSHDARDEFEKEQVDRAIELSKQETLLQQEKDDLEKALEESALQLSEEEQLAWALSESKAEKKSEELTEEEYLQQAIQASLQQG